MENFADPLPYFFLADPRETPQILGSHHFYREGGGRLFSGPPLGMRKKIWSPSLREKNVGTPFGFVKKLWSSPLGCKNCGEGTKQFWEKILVTLLWDPQKILVPPFDLLKKYWSPPCTTPKNSGPSPQQPDGPPLQVKNDSSLIMCKNQDWQWSKNLVPPINMAKNNCSPPPTKYRSLKAADTITEEFGWLVP